jgi:hypothetical protein
MERWYAGYRCRKNPEEVIRYISRKVKDYNLGYYVPLLRIEKREKARQEYYFFIAFQSDRFGHIPDSVVNSKLLDPSQPYFKTTAVRPEQNKFRYDDIKQMVGLVHQIEDYTNPIPYTPIQVKTPRDPFSLPLNSQEKNLIKIHDQNPPSDLDDLSNYLQPTNLIDGRHQNLLYYLSALGTGTWEKFMNICRVLNIPEPQRILRKLKLLGHLETSSDGGKWSISPTSLVQIEARGTYLICGQQTESLLNQLAKYGTVTPNPLRNSLKLGDYNLEQVIAGIQKSLTVSIHNAGTVAERLAEILPDIETWRSGLPVLNGIVPSLYRWRYFQEGQFIESGFPHQTGMYQMLNSDSNHIRSTIFYEAETKTFRRGDWYGLRFLALHATGKSLIVRHSSNSNRLAVPYSQRWPEIYERALVLASGNLPQFVERENNLWLIYQGIDSHLLKLMIQKLNLTRGE